MSYLVLARKWRPQRFEDVVGQQHVTRTLANAIRQDRVAHAFLFTGSRGIGKTSTARILAKALNCEKGPTAEPCNVCSACIEITEGHAVDVIEIDGASNRGINEIREVREAVRYAPSRDRFKVYIIDEVHMLTTEAFNALLKTLEEPPSHAIFVFATTEPNKIPVTILSRCQRYDFKRVQLRDMVECLQGIADAEHLPFDEGSLALIARHARGGMRDALSAMDQVTAFAGGKIHAESTAEILGVASRKNLLDLGHALATHDVDGALKILDHLDRYGHDLVQFSTEILQHLRDMTVVRALKDPHGVTELSPQELDFVRHDVADVPLSQLQRMFQICAEAVEQIHRSQFPKLLLEMTLVKLAAVEPLVPLEPIVAKLQAIEAALAGQADLDDQTLERYRKLLATYAPTPAPVILAAPPVPFAPPPTPSPPRPPTPTVSAAPDAAPLSAPIAPKPTVVAAPPVQFVEPPKPTVAATAPEPVAAAAPEPVAAAAPEPVAETAKALELEVALGLAAVDPTPPCDPVPSPTLPAEAKGDETTAGAETTASPTGDQDQERWRGFLQGLPPILANVLRHGTLVHFDDERLEFWLPPQYLALFAEEQRTQLSDALFDTFEKRLLVMVLEGPAPADGRQSLADESAQAQDASRQAQHRRIREDERLNHAMELFKVDETGISIDLINPDGEHPQ